MMEHPFELIPFPAPEIPKIKITGSVIQAGKILTVQYSLSGKVNEVLFPTLDPQPGRRNGLWLATCFEFFLAFPEESQYWEFNFSPSGDWNIYRMKAYRQFEIHEEVLFEKPELTLRKGRHCFQLVASVELSPIFELDNGIQAGIACVIQTRDRHETYWALTHPASQADFHLREGFILTI
jgi:hypothetical protein